MAFCTVVAVAAVTGHSRRALRISRGVLLYAESQSFLACSIQVQAAHTSVAIILMKPTFQPVEFV
jgi:hypothetical protein